MGLIKCAATSTVQLLPDQRMVVPGFVSNKVPGCNSLAMLHPTEKQTLGKEVEVTPFLVRLTDSSERFQVELSNPTKVRVLIQPNAVLCELQQVEVSEGAEGWEEAQAEQGTEGEGDEDLEKFLKRSNLEDTDLQGEDKQEARALFSEFQCNFSWRPFDIGHTKTVTHKIRLSDDIPFKQCPRHIPPGMYQKVRDHLQQLLDCGVIEPSSSPYASGVVLVRKKTGALRCCVDYRQLNACTVKDSYALPRIEEMVDHLKGAAYFSTLDMRSG